MKHPGNRGGRCSHCDGTRLVVVVVVDRVFAYTAYAYDHYYYHVDPSKVFMTAVDASLLSAAKSCLQR